MRYGLTVHLSPVYCSACTMHPQKPPKGGIGGYLLGSRASSGAGITVAAAAAGKSIKAKF